MARARGWYPAVAMLEGQDAMTARKPPRSSLPTLFAAALAGAVVSVTLASARADQPAQPAQPSMVCRVSGEAPGKPGEMIYDAHSSGSAIAKLTGASVPLELAHVVPPGGGRVQVSTGTSRPYLRIDGWASVDAFRFYAATDLPIAGAGGHVSIARGQTLNITAVQGDELSVAHRVLGSSHQAVTAKLGCDQATLSYPSQSFPDVPERARTYQMGHDTLDLYNSPGGDVVFTLALDQDVRAIFWSDEHRGGYVHVHLRTDLVIDAWAPAHELEPLHHQEVFGPSSAPRPPRPRTLALQNPPELLTATEELTIYHAPHRGSATLGVVEVGARFYPMEQSGEMTNVMPENLGVLPLDNLGFWVITADLPQ